MKQIIKSLMLAVLLLTAGFANAQTHYNLQIGTGTATNNYVPDYILYNYSYTQMLYTAGDVGIDGTIDTIAFQSGTASGQTRTLTIYMAEVGQTTLTNQVSADQFHQVYSGSVSWTSGWTYIPLDTVFDYQDTGSLVIAVIDGTGTWVSSISFLGTTMSDTRSKYIYSDYDTYTLSTSISNSTNFVPNIKLGISSYSTYCAQPSDVAVTNIVSDEATISWTENGDATSWEVIVSDEVVTDFDNAASYTVTGTPSFTVTNLSGNTQYYVYVRAVCGSSSESGWTNAVTFTSACMGVTSVPYTTGFEGIATGNLPNCWQALASGSSSSSTFPSAYVYATNARNGNVYFEFESSTGQTEIAALPEMDNIDGLQLDFYASCMNLNFVFEVGVIENDSDFVVVDTVALTAGSGNNWHDSYYPYTVYFNQYSGSGSRMAMRVTASGTTSYTLMIDDLSVSEIPSCIAPTNFSVAGTGSDWATLGWTDDNGSNWEVIYDSVSFDPDNNSLGTETASTNSITLSNLSSGVQYTAYVRTNCGGGDYSAWVGPLTFVPGTYIMEANSTDTLYTCGSAIYDNGGPNGQYTSSNESYLYVFPTDPTQVLSVSGFSTTEGSYDYVRITDLTTNEVLFYDNSTPDGWTIGPFTTYGGIEIYFHSDGSVVKDGYEIFVSCTDAPTCLPVSNLHVSHLNVDSVVVAWIDTINSGANYNVEYRPAGSTNWNSIVTSDDFLAIDMLTANTTYEIRVTALCGGGDSSVSSSIITARTLASEPVDVLPFICTFEDGSVNAYWTLENGSETNAWYIGGGVNNGGDSALYISNDNGATNSYSISSTSNVFAYVTVNLESGDYAYSFDWQAYGESSFDYIRAALVPASTDLTAGSLCGFGTSTMPSGSIALDGGTKLNLNSSWITRNGVVTVPNGSYKLVFFWHNDASSGTTPPAAIDNVSFAQLSCSTPTNLTATSITTDAITLTWTAGGDETSWLVSDGTNSYVANSTSYTLTNLTINTNYTISVRALCGADDTSFAVTGTYRTLAGDPVDVLPFTSNFENTATNLLWVLENGSESNVWYIGNAVNNGGDSALYISNDNGTSNTYNTSNTSTVFAYVAITLDSGEYVYSFDWQAYGESSYDYIRAALVPAGTDLVAGNLGGFGTTTLPAGCIALDGGSKLNLSNNWTTQLGTVDVPAGTYKLTFMWRNDASSGTMPPAAIDNVQFAANSCPQPSQFTSSADSTEITISWTHGGTETSWVVSDGTTSVVVNDTFYTFTNLTPSTVYSFTVAALCGAGDTSMTIGGTVSTTCGAFALPFIEGFENPATLSCWQILNLDNYANSDWALSQDTPHSGSNCMKTGYNSSSDANDWLVTPELFLPVNATGYYVEWYAMGDSWASDVTHMTVVVLSEDATNNTVSDTIYNAVVTDGWNQYNYNISAYSGQSIQIAFIYNGNYDHGARIDDIFIGAIPTCPQPTVMTAVSGLNDIQVIWNHGGTESAWEVSDGTTTVVVYDTFYTFTGLAAATTYNFTVRAVCSAGDTSYYLNGSFSTLNSLPVTTLPYTCTFAGAEGTAWTLENGSQTNIWVVDTAAHNGNADNYGLYITNDGGASNNYNSSSASVVFAYRTFTLPAGDYAYSFDWRANGESSYDYIRAAMVPVSVDMTAGDNTGWSTSALPAGAISLDGGTKLNLISNWTTQSGEITIPTVGQYNMVFFWRNDGSVGNQPPAAIDNIDFRANTCPAVTGITMTDAGIDYVSVDWTSSASAWQVQYGPSGFTLGSGTTINTSNHPVTISNLDAMTSYDVWVRPVCGAGDTGTWRGAMVSTSFCSNANVVTIGDTANYDAYATTDMPISTYYNYSLCEIIVDSAEMGGPMDIDAVEFYYYSNYTLDDETDIDIYLQPTSKVEFDDEYDAVALASNAVHVFHGSFEDFVPGWNTVVFDTMYPYNGNGNLMLIIKDNSGVYNSSLYFVSVECDGNKTLTYYDDYDNPDATDPSTFDGYNMEVLEERPFMHLISCGAGCPKPNGLTATASETFGSYQFSWNGSVSTYEVALKSATEGVWPAETQITTNSYSVSNLMPATTYTFRVRSVCDDATTSTWATVSFTTDSMPCLTPSDFHVVSTTLTSVTFDWTVNGEETAWRIYVWNTGTQAMTFDVTSHPATISGLAQTTSYNAVVMALCGGSIESDPSETITFTTTECQPVSNANVSNVHDESAVVSWNGDAPSYTIEYGLGDFEQGYGTTVSDITATTYTITGLTPDRSYSVYVRADCDATNYSAWSQRLTFRTTNDGIDDVNGMNLTIYPNPTTDNTTIALSGVSGEVTITIVDLSGRTVKTDSMSCDGDCVKTVEVSGLAEGAYFVRVTGEGVNMVKKLVVK